MGDGTKFSGRDQGGVDRSVSVGVHRQASLQGASSRAFTREIEEAVTSQVDHRGSVGGRFVGDRKFVSIGEAVCDRHMQGARIAFLPIETDIRQAHTGDLAAGDAINVPNDFIESLDSTMQTVWAIILGQTIGIAVQGKSAVLDAIGIAPDGCAEIVWMFDVVAQRRAPQDDVGLGTVAGRLHERLQGRTVGDDACRKTMFVAQRYLIHGSAVAQSAEVRLNRGGGIGAPRRQAEHCAG